MKVLENGVNEQFLVAAAQQDPSRFAELYESNFDRVYAYVSRRVSHRHDAEDLTAEVLHAALRDLARFEWRGLPFAAWLMGISPVIYWLIDGGMQESGQRSPPTIWSEVTQALTASIPRSSTPRVSGPGLPTRRSRSAPCVTNGKPPGRSRARQS